MAHIAIVTDNAQVRRAIAYSLISHGHRTTHLDSATALGYLQGELPDAIVVLSDIEDVEGLIWVGAAPVLVAIHPPPSGRLPTVPGAHGVVSASSGFDFGALRSEVRRLCALGPIGPKR